MELLQAIAHRHSYRGEFEPTSIPRESLQRIVQAGIQAPSGYNGQSTSFVILDDPQTLRRVLACIGDGVHLKTAPSAVVVVMNPEAAQDRDYSFGIQDYSAAVENMLLTISALDYASVWIEGGIMRDEVASRIAGIIGVTPPLEVRVVLPIGRPVEWRQQNAKRPFEERAWFNSYGAMGR